MRKVFGCFGETILESYQKSSSRLSPVWSREKKSVWSSFGNDPLARLPTILNQKSRLGSWVRGELDKMRREFEFWEIDTTYCGIFHETWRQGTRAVGEMGAKSHPRASIRREFDSSVITPFFCVVRIISLKFHQIHFSSV